MSRFYVGQRVRIKYSNGWPELIGQEGTIVKRTVGGGVLGDSEWDVAPDSWGSCIAPRKGNYGGSQFAPNSSQLEPITDSNELVSWESMRGLWVPDHMRERA